MSVENALYVDDGVYEVAAVGVPDDRLGELVTALVTLKPGHSKRITTAFLMDLARKRSVLGFRDKLFETSLKFHPVFRNLLYLL